MTGFKWIIAGIGGMFALNLLRKKGGLLKTVSTDKVSVTCSLAGRPIFASSTLNVPLTFLFKTNRIEQMPIKVNSITVNHGNTAIAVSNYSDKNATLDRAGKIEDCIVAIPYNSISQEFGQNISAEIVSGVYDNLLKNITITANITVGNYGLVFARPLNIAHEWNLKNINISGLGLCAASLRKIGSINDYIAYLPSIDKLEHEDKIVKANGTVQDTAAIMHAVVDKYKDDTKQLANWLKRSNLKDTLQSIFNFVYGYIQYVPDSRVVEQVRRPLRTLYDQKGDCDCYATLIASILTNLGIDYEFRIAAYERDWQHVYIIVPHSSGYYVVDPVLDKCFAEKKFSKNLDL